MYSLLYVVPVQAHHKYQKVATEYLVEETGARLVSTIIFKPSVLSQLDFEFTSQGQFHVLVVVSKYDNKCEQS